MINEIENLKELLSEKIRGETSPLSEALELKSRYQAVVEAMKAFRELLPLASVWIKDQEDYESNPFKQAMIASFCKVCVEKIPETLAEFKEIQPRILALAAKFSNPAAKKEKV